MNKNWLLVPILVFLAFAGFTTVVGAGEEKGTDYAALAAKYDKLAADQEAVIKEHRDMLAKAGVQNPGSSKHGGNPMDKHCNSIIKDAQKLKADYKAFANWCRLAAKEGIK